MNNFDLAVKIEECLTEVNALDAIEKIVELRKEYKDSEFYKKTKMSFEQCVEMYGKIIQVKMSRKNLGDTIEDYILNLNLRQMQKIVDKLATLLEKTDLTVIENYLSNLTKTIDFTELQSKIQKFEELNIRASKL